MPKGQVFETFFPPIVRERLAELGNVEYNGMGRQFTQAELKMKLKSKDVAITGWSTGFIDGSVLEGNTRLKLIAHTGGTVGGYVDDTTYDAGVTVLSGNKYYAESVSEGVLGYMLFMLRDLGRFSQGMREGKWLDGATEGLLDQTVGIVSLGMIGKLVVKQLKPFRCKIKVYSTHPNADLAAEMGFTYANLEDIFSTCKIISVHTANRPETVKMINAKHFSLMRDGAIFINTSRAPVLDEAALVEALKTKKIRALLDVYNQEPLPATSELYKLDNLTMFPHMAGPTQDRRKYVTLGLADDIARFFNGEPLQLEITRAYAHGMTIEQ
jgi:phosphoglycerate dehydrogenase-like enzyme